MLPESGASVRQPALELVFSFDRSRPYPYYCAPMCAAPSDQPLPRLGNPRKFAQQGVRLSGQVPLSALERLGEALVTNEGQAEVALAFGISEERKLVVRGRVGAELVLTCQRCLGPVN